MAVTQTGTKSTRTKPEPSCEEEEKETFPESRASDLDVKALGAQLAERKAELMAKVS